MDISVVITLVAVLLIQLLLPHPRFVKAQYQYDLPEPAPEPHPPGRPVPVNFSLVVPLRYQRGIHEMLAELLVSDRRDFEIVLVVGTDDSESGPACRDLATAFPDRVRVVESPPDSVRTRAGSLNTAIPHCNGEVVGVIEGGDPVRASLLDRVDGAYRVSGAAIIRVAVDIPDATSIAELYSLTNGLVCVRGTRPVRVTKRIQLTPSAAYFVRTDLLRVLGGWDEDCLDEEPELLLRLSSFGATDAMLYGEPARHTRSGPSFWAYRVLWAALRRQRVRWYTSLIRVHRTGEWRRFPSFRDRTAARYALLGPVFQGLFSTPALAAAFLLTFVWPDQSLYRFALPLGTVYASATANVWGATWLRAQSRGTGRISLADALDPRALWFKVAVLAGWGLDLAVRLAAALRAVWGYLRSDAKVLSDHFERSRHEPPKRPARTTPAPEAASPEPPPPAHPDLLAVAGSPDTPAAVQAMATGLDTLFRALGPPPESLRLAEAGPTPQGDGGTSDG
ncbi:glycosyltransferase [Streptomyces sp. NPDC060028]|uniref:glycosyltransferase n=1 Tax=Streptomyces sp. NPDC060028 TaxID=3347041 RepID=UPI00369A5C36